MLFTVQHLFQGNCLAQVYESQLNNITRDYKYTLLRTLLCCFSSACWILCELPSICVPQLSKAVVGSILPLIELY